MPLAEPRDLPARLTLRGAGPAREVRLRLNLTEVAGLRLDEGWRQVEVDLPARAFLPGPNWLCFVSEAAPGAEEEPTLALAVFERR